MAYTTPSTQPTGTIITSSMYNNHLINNVKFLHGPPTVRLRRLATQTIVANTWTAIAWSSKDWDTNSMFATTGTKITCKTAGKYQVNANTIFIGSTTGSVRFSGLRKNSTGTGSPTDGFVTMKVNTVTARQAALAYPMVVSLTTGQFLEVVIWSDGSSNGLKTSTAAAAGPIVSVLWVSS